MICPVVLGVRANLSGREYALSLRGVVKLTFQAMNFGFAQRFRGLVLNYPDASTPLRSDESSKRTLSLRGVVKVTFQERYYTFARCFSGCGVYMSGPDGRGNNLSL